MDEFAQFRGRFEELGQLEMPLPQSSGALRRLETPQSAVEGLDDARRAGESPKARAERKNEAPTGVPEPDTTTALAHQLIERKIKPAAAARARRLGLQALGRHTCTRTSCAIVSAQASTAGIQI